MSCNLIEHFEDLPDPRVRGRTDYPLIEIVFLCISAIISGFDGWEAIEDFGKGKLDWLKKYLPYENGIPRHDTIARVMSCLSPKSLQSSFVSWVQSIAKITEGEIVAIDGKQARRSYNKKDRKAAIHMVSAWACQNGVVLGQQKNDSKSNEITAIPQLLECGADYVLALKGNQSELQEMVDDFFSTAIEKKIVAIEHSKIEDNDYGHGRIESRTCYSVALPAYLRDFQDNWVDLKSLACVVCSREINNVITHEKRYYVSSLESSAAKISHAIRCHWHVENSLHWVMDVTFKEDDSRIRRGVSAENMSVMRHLALNLIKKESQEAKFSVPRKRRKAGLYDEYREKVLGI